MADNRIDIIDDTWDVEALTAKQRASIALLDEWVTKVTEASKNSRISEVFVGDGGNLYKMVDGIKQATVATNEHEAATRKLFEAKKNELDLAIRQSVVDANNAKAKNEEAQATKAQTEETIALTKEKERLAKEAAKEEAQAKKLQGEYDQLKKRYNDTAKEVLNIGARLGVTSKEFIEGAAGVKKMHDELYSLESAIGRSQRNVGNYASAWNGLQNSVNQLSRDIPAFANSIQTGFMAISNNIPIVVDEINKLKEKNAQLAEQGLATVPIWKQMATAVFSWQTALSAAITLLVLYGDDVINFFTGSGEEAKKQQSNIDGFTQSLKNLRDAAAKLDQDMQNQAQVDIARMGAQGATEEEITKKSMDNIDKRYIANQKNIIKLKQELEDAKAYGKQLIDDGAEDDIFNKQVENVSRIKEEIAQAEAKSAQLKTQYLTTYYNSEKSLNDKSKQDRDKASEDDKRRLQEWRRKATEEFTLQYQTQKQGLEAEAEVQKKLADDEGLSLDTRMQALEKYYNIKFRLIDQAAEYERLKGNKSALEEEEILKQRDIAAKKTTDEMLDAYTAMTYKQMESDDKHLKQQKQNLIDLTKAAKESWDKILSDDKKAQDKQIKQEIEALNTLKATATQIINSISSVYAARTAKNLASLQAESTRADADKERQLKALDELGLGTQEYDRRKADIEARAQDRKNRIAQEEANTQQRQADFQKELAMYQAILSMYVGIAKEIDKGGVFGIATGLAIAGYMAGVIAAIAGTETPAYGDGTPAGGHPKDGPAIVGEKKVNGYYRPERVTLPGGKSFIASSPMYMNMPKGTVVEPLDEVRNAASAIYAQTGMPVLPAYNDSAAPNMNAGFDKVIQAINSKPENHYHFKNGEWINSIVHGDKVITYHNANNG